MATSSSRDGVTSVIGVGSRLLSTWPWHSSLAPASHLLPVAGGRPKEGVVR